MIKKNANTHIKNYSRHESHVVMKTKCLQEELDVNTDYKERKFSTTWGEWRNVKTV